MRQSVQIILLFICIPATVIGQRQNKTNLVLSLEDSRYEHSYNLYIPGKVIFYRNGVRYKKITYRDFREGNLVLTNFRTGAYKVKYRNIYGQYVSKRIRIPGSTVYKLRLYLDSLQKYVSADSADILNEGDSVSVIRYRYGCNMLVFPPVAEIITITKSGGKLIGQYQKGKSVEQTVTLNNEQLSYFCRFEQELRFFMADSHIDVTGERDTYMLVRKGKVQQREYCCRIWDGFSILISKLFESQNSISNIGLKLW